MSQNTEITHWTYNNNFKYDLVIRCRLDFFAYEDFLNPHNVNANVIYLPVSKYNNHKDDSGFIMNRHCIEYFKTFLVEPAVVPQLKQLPEVKFFDRMAMFMPEPLVVEKAARPFQHAEAKLF